MDNANTIEFILAPHFDPKQRLFFIENWLEARTESVEYEGVDIFLKGAYDDCDLGYIGCEISLMSKTSKRIRFTAESYVIDKDGNIVNARYLNRYGGSLRTITSDITDANISTNIREEVNCGLLG